MTVVYVHPKANNKNQPLSYKSIPFPRLAQLTITVYTWSHHIGHVFSGGRWQLEIFQGCLDSTVWEEFIESSRDINKLTDVVSYWVTYCEDIVVPIKAVKAYSVSKLGEQLYLVLLNKNNGF